MIVIWVIPDQPKGGHVVTLRGGDLTMGGRDGAASRDRNRVVPYRPSRLVERTNSTGVLESWSQGFQAPHKSSEALLGWVS